MARYAPFDNFGTDEIRPRQEVWDMMGGAPASWTATAVNSGAASAGTSYYGGTVRLSGAATTDNSGVNFQLAGAPVFLEAGVHQFRFRFILDEDTSANVATESDLWFGIATSDTSIIGSAPTNGVYLKKDDGDTNLGFVTMLATVATEHSAALLTVAADTWYEVDLRITITATGAGTVEVFINGTSYVSLTLASGLPAATSAMSPFVAFQSGDNTGTKWVEVDYVAMELGRTA